MPILTIRHITSYHYRRPVAFGEHRMMLRPRDDDDQKVLESALDISPPPSEISWTKDVFGNHVGTARFSGSARELSFASTIYVEHAVAGLDAADIEAHAQTYPFVYPENDGLDLARYVAAPPPHPELKRWTAGFLDEDGSADTYALFVGMTQTIRRTFKHRARHQKGVQDPLRTLALGTGSCRDLAVLMIASLRSLGIAARFVSGYLKVGDPDDERITGGNTHAWVQAYIPGAGWVDFDPSTGRVGNEDLVRVAVVDQPCEAIPLSGTWIGKATDHLAMKVAVKVIGA